MLYEDEEPDLTDEVRDMLHTVTAQSIVIQILVNAVEAVQPGMRDKIVHATHDAARQAARSGLQDLTAELQEIAGKLRP